MSVPLQIFVSLISTLIASTGFWTYIQKKGSYSKASTNMLIGLGHDRIVDLGLKYIQRGWISKDEFENLHRYLYTPYRELGGNGSAHKIMEEVGKLPLKTFNMAEIIREYL